MDVTAESLAGMFGEIFPHLDERQPAAGDGGAARALGHGGIRLVARAAGVREGTVSLGAAELEAGAEPLGRARRPGGPRAGGGQGSGAGAGVDGAGGAGGAGRPGVAAAVDHEIHREAGGGRPARGIRSARIRSGTCCAPRGSACRPTSRRSRAGSTRTAMPSSGTSPRRPVSTWMPGSR